MKPFAIFIVAALVSAATAFVVTALHSGGATKPSVAQASGVDSASDVQSSIAGIEKRQTEMSKALDELRMQIAAKEAPARIPMGEIDAAVARALKERGASAAGSAAAVAAASDKGSTKPTATSLFAQLVDGNLNWNDAQALWKQVEDPAVMAELVAMFEERAKLNPNDPKAQLELGKAYLQKVFKAGAGPEAGVWATKADKSFDKALAIDDHDWSSRFYKAMSLSNWPAFLGKQNEAIANFDILVKQQDSMPVQPMHAQTHVLLGNMYMSMGQKDKALAAWQKGLSIFPDNDELKKQIAGAQAH